MIDSLFAIVLFTYWGLCVMFDFVFIADCGCLLACDCHTCFASLRIYCGFDFIVIRDWAVVLWFNWLVC